jgi:hypothetical protein
MKSLWITEGIIVGETVKWKCELCGGSGKVYDPQCAAPACNAGFTEGQIMSIYASPQKYLPCGHRLKYLVEDGPCPECNGRGFFEG